MRCRLCLSYYFLGPPRRRLLFLRRLLDWLLRWDERIEIDERERVGEEGRSLLEKVELLVCSTCDRKLEYAETIIVIT